MDDLPRLPDTKYLTLDDPYAPPLQLMVPIPTKETCWGVLEPLRGTFWEQFVFEVSGDLYSRANLKDTRPLRQHLGRPPKVNAKQLPLVRGQCALLDTCIIADASKCKIPSRSLPLCYMAPADDEIRHLVTALVVALNAGVYAVVVKGDEFVL